MLDVEFAQLTDPGRVREGNEDYLGHVLPGTPAEARARGWLFALADGVGGQERGEVASHLAIETILAGFREASSAEAHAPMLQRLAQAANTRIYEAGEEAHRPCATTLVACALRYDRAVVAHAGDSRCYLIRGASATALTRDHTVASEQARLGLAPAGTGAESPTRYLLSRSLGNEMFVSIETREVNLHPGDMLLLCSDGLHGAIGAPEIARVASHSGSLAEAAQKLVAIANQRDGSDNISVQLIRVRSVERVGMYRGRPYKLH
ncbi:MAG: PP2C family protein-serine/threonine phosphatase [Terriglobia bacterium]